MPFSGQPNLVDHMHFGGPQTCSKLNEAVFCIRSTRNAYFSLFRYLRKTTSSDLTNVFLTEGLHEMDVSVKRSRLAFIILKRTQKLTNRPHGTHHACKPVRKHCTGDPVPNGAAR